MSHDIKRPFYEDFLARNFPAWGMQREFARQINATYRGGVATRTDRSFSTGDTSYIGGTSSRRQSLFSMRDRARQAQRDNPLARSLLNCETDNVVADGFRFQARTKVNYFNREAEDRFPEWMDNADVRGMLSASQQQRQWYSNSRRDGDGGIVLVARGADSKLQWIPGDLIKTPDGKWGDAAIIDGVEIDKACRPIAFHVADLDENGKRSFARIPARDFIYLTPGIETDDLQVRGTSVFAQIFRELDQLNEYTDALIVAARMACVFGLIFKSNNPGKELAGLERTRNSKGDDQRAVRLENGSLRMVGTAEDVVQVQAQQPMQQAPDFIRMMCRLIGTAFDMPLELVLRDMSQVNFASARIGLLSYYRACWSRREWFKKRVLDRIYQWWISRERQKKELGIDGAFITAFPDDYWAHTFIGRGWDYTDPVSEAQADLLQMDMGTKSPQGVAAERGRDWEEIQTEREAANAYLRARELPIAHSTYTRDPAPPSDLAAVKAKTDAYGVAVRAGLLTPTLEDEKLVRADVGLPAPNEDVQKAWEEDGGVRKPITLQAEGGTSPFGAAAPASNQPDEETSDQE